MNTPITIIAQTGAIIHDGSPLVQGQTISMPAEDAERLIEKGLAIPAVVEKPAKKREKDVEPPVEPDQTETEPPVTEDLHTPETEATQPAYENEGW